jgi:hypothetical protein
MNPPDQPTATPRTDAAWAASFSPERATCSVRDECEKLERELTALRAEVYQARRAWLGDDYGHLPLIDALEKFRSDSDAEENRSLVFYQRACEVEHQLRAEVERWQTVAATMSEEREHNANEASRLRAEVERLKEQLRIESAVSAHALHWAEKAEAALAFIAENGGTTHETECGTIACNGLWCAEQARAAMKGTP